MLNGLNQEITMFLVKFIVRLIKLKKKIRDTHLTIRGLNQKILINSMFLFKNLFLP